MSLTTTGDTLRAAKRIISTIELNDGLHKEDIADPHDRVGAALTSRMYGCWKTNGRQVLSMSPELVAEIALATSARIPTETWRTLPYLNPLIVFPEPIPIPSLRPDEETLLLHGLLVCGLSGKPARTEEEMEYMVYDTHDPAADKLYSLNLIEVLGPDKSHVDWEYNRLTFPLTGPAFTMQERVEEAIDGGRGHFRWGVEEFLIDKTIKREFIGSLVSTIIGTLMYLCSTTIDTETVPAAAVRKEFGSRKSSTPAVTKVGWKIGPALSRLRREHTHTVHPGTGRQLAAPHQRRAHFALRWTGPGRTVPKTVFIAPTWVRADLLGEFDVKTVREVRSERGLSR